MTTITSDLSPRAASTVKLNSRKLSPLIGSEVYDVDLKATQSDDTIAAIRALLLERGVIFFPGQHLSPEQHLALAGRFGVVDVPTRARPNSPLPGISVFDSRDEVYGRVSRWHADLTSSETPQSIAVFQPVTLPEVGGDTIWASTEAAYDRLSEPLQKAIEELVAVHALTPIKTSEWGKGNLGFHWAEHPVVRVHPETGRKSLFVSPRYTTEILGLRPHESAALLKLLNEHITQPEHQVRYRWTEGTIAFWDNRSTLHYAVDDYDDALRIVHRVGILGDRPFGVKR